MLCARRRHEWHDEGVENGRRRDVVVVVKERGREGLTPKWWARRFKSDSHYSVVKVDSVGPCFGSGPRKMRSAIRYWTRDGGTIGLTALEARTIGLTALVARTIGQTAIEVRTRAELYSAHLVVEFLSDTSTSCVQVQHKGTGSLCALLFSSVCSPRGVYHCSATFLAVARLPTFTGHA